MSTISDKLLQLSSIKENTYGAVKDGGLDPSTHTFENIHELWPNMPSSIYQDKTVVPAATDVVVHPDDGYIGLRNINIPAEFNIQPWNIPEGITMFGMTGTMKFKVGTDWPDNLPVTEEEMDTAVTEVDAEVPVEDKFVLADNEGNITTGYMYDAYAVNGIYPTATKAKFAKLLPYNRYCRILTQEEFQQGIPEDFLLERDCINVTEMLGGTIPDSSEKASFSLDPQTTPTEKQIFYMHSIGNFVAGGVMTTEAPGDNTYPRYFCLVIGGNGGDASYLYACYYNQTENIFESTNQTTCRYGGTITWYLKHPNYASGNVTKLYNGMELPVIPAASEYLSSYPKMIIVGTNTVYYGWNGHFDYSEGSVSISGYNKSSSLKRGEWTTPDLVRGAGFTVSVSDISWSNFDIVDADGNVVVSGSDPVSPGSGLMVYNGTVLPELPETEHPHAVIWGSSAFGLYCDLCSQVPVVGANGKVRFYGVYQHYTLNAAKDGWQHGSDIEVGDGGEDVIDPSLTPLLWANADILNADGAVYLSGSEPTPYTGFEITAYDPTTTEFKAVGWRRVSKHTTGEDAGKITRDNFTRQESGGLNYLRNIRQCTREKLYYKGVEVWPNYGGNYVWETLIDTVEVTTAVNENTGTGYPVSWPYAFGDNSKNLTFDDFYWSDQNTEVPYLRITVDGVSAIFPLEYMTVDYLCGNHHIAWGDEYADNGYEFCVQFSPGGTECATGFSSRNPGTYKVKIEKAVSING